LNKRQAKIERLFLSLCMVKWKFTIAEKHAIHTVLGPKCIWCNSIVFMNDVEVDHVIPEKTPQSEAIELIEKFKLSNEFQINSFYNWAPIHPACNKGKGADRFNDAPIIMQILHKISKRVPEIIQIHENAKRRLKNGFQFADLRNAIENKELTEEDLELFLKGKNVQGKKKGTTYNSTFRCNIKTVKQKGTYGKLTPKQTYNVWYDQFDSKNKHLKEFNCILQFQAQAALMNARESYFNFIHDIVQDEYTIDTDNSYDFGTHFSLISRKIISYTSTTRIYNYGAAHEDYTISGHSYHVDPLRPLFLEDMILNYEQFIFKIAPIAYQKMIDEIKGYEPETEITEHYPIEKAWLTPEFNAFKNYHFTEKSVAFIFNPYEISPWSYGAQFPEFSFQELIDLFPQEEKLVKFLSTINKRKKK
jgi:hypothetical protein